MAPAAGRGPSPTRIWRTSPGRGADHGALPATAPPRGGCRPRGGGPAGAPPAGAAAGGGGGGEGGGAPRPAAPPAVSCNSTKGKLPPVTACGWSTPSIASDTGVGGAGLTVNVPEADG